MKPATNSNLKVVILTQEDFFTIPGNVERIMTLPGIEVPLIAVIDSKGSVVNKKEFFLRGFGIKQCSYLGIRIIIARIKDFADWLFKWTLFSQRNSIKAVARSNRINLLTISNPNADEFLATLKELRPDIVLSFSAPVIFCPKLLAIPRIGCINLHCSLLPHYAGLLPSFWVLYHSEKETGATIHCMDSRIDNGAILAQQRVPIDPGMTMFGLIKRTKAIGGELARQVLTCIIRGEPLPALPNRLENGDYFSWPTIEQMREFRRHGGKLI
jgi:folate-dependent phosphoribosylglycinamide formyltransferase PurN